MLNRSLTEVKVSGHSSQLSAILALKTLEQIVDFRQLRVSFGAVGFVVSKSGVHLGSREVRVGIEDVIESHRHTLGFTCDLTGLDVAAGNDRTHLSNIDDFLRRVPGLQGSTRTAVRDGSDCAGGRLLTCITPENEAASSTPERYRKHGHSVSSHRGRAASTDCSCRRYRPRSQARALLQASFYGGERQGAHDVLAQGQTGVSLSKCGPEHTDDASWISDTDLNVRLIVDTGPRVHGGPLDERGSDGVILIRKSCLQGVPHNGAIQTPSLSIPPAINGQLDVQRFQAFVAKLQFLGMAYVHEIEAICQLNNCADNAGIVIPGVSKIKCSSRPVLPKIDTWSEPIVVVRAGPKCVSVEERTCRRAAAAMVAEHNSVVLHTVASIVSESRGESTLCASITAGVDSDRAVWHPAYRAGCVQWRRDSDAPLPKGAPSSPYGGAPLQLRIDYRGSLEFLSSPIGAVGTPICESTV